MFHPERSVLYLNIDILDPSDAVKRKVGKNIAKSNLPAPFKSIASVAGPKLASDLASNKVVATRMGQKMSEKMPRKLREKGIEAVVESVFQEGSYLVLQMQIQHVDMLKLASSPPPPSNSKEVARVETEISPMKAWVIAFWTWLYWLVGARYQSILERDYLPSIVQARMESAISEMLHEKLLKKQVIADAVVLRQDQQVRYFYDKVKQVRIRQSETQGPPVRRAFRRKLNSKASQSDSEDSTGSHEKKSK